MLPEQLSAFGISSVEARMYLHLIGKPPKSILDIARELDLPRTSVYDHALKLAEKGLVQRIVKHKSQQLQAYPISILQAYIDKEKARVDGLQDTLIALEEAIAHPTPSPLATEVRYFHGSKGLQQMMWNTLKAKDEIVGYAQFGLAAAVSQRFAEKWASELSRRHIPNRVITNPQYVDSWRFSQGPIAAYRRTLQQCKVIGPDKLHISGDTTIYNNVFAVAHWAHGELVGVEIENSEIVKAQRSMFNLAWEQGELARMADPPAK